MPARSTALLLTLFSACGPNLEPGPEQSRNAILGGDVDLGDPEVFYLGTQNDNSTWSDCTATLIGRRTLVTSAHCVDDRTGPPGSHRTGTIVVTNKTVRSTAAPAERFAVIEKRVHEGFDPSRDLQNDIALLLLQSPPGVTPKAFSTTPLDALTGAPIRVLGYGNSAPTTGVGTKRAVQLTIRRVMPSSFELGDLVSSGVCSGDSGGPSFRTFEDGVERQVGIHSFTRDLTCVDGVDLRIDTFAPFVQAWLDEKEPPTCEADGHCKADCAAHDPDCAAIGEPCVSALGCDRRVCTTDAQTTVSFCSQPCTGSTGCPDPLECNAGVCRHPSPAPVVIPGPPVETGPRAGCTSAPGALGALGALAALRLLSRRRRGPSRRLARPCSMTNVRRRTRRL